MDISKEFLIRKIKGEEGDKQYPYKCPADKWTIGAGINLEAQEIPLEVVAKWGDTTDCMGVFLGAQLAMSIFKDGLPQGVRDLWLEVILDRLINEIANRLHDEYDMSYGDLPEDCQLVMVDCCYQMGVNGFFAFKKTLTHIKNLDWAEAAYELVDSKYCRDTPERAKRNSDLLFGCEAPF